MTVRILNAGLEEDPESKEIVIRGVVDQTTLKFINIAWYQREQGFSDGHIQEIVSGYLLSPRIADITLGMRGTRLQSTGSTYNLLDKTFCVDGGQRLYAAAVAVRERPDLKIALGAKVYTNTNEEFENELFCKLGTTAVRVAVSVLMRNQKKKSPAAAFLLSLCRDDAFALKDRITWDQVRTRQQLMSGFSLARITGALHAHKLGGLKSTKVYDLLAGLDLLIEMIGVDTIRTNMIRLFDAIDACWTVRQLSGARDESRPHLKPEFLIPLVSLLSLYSEFWDGSPRSEFYISDKYIKRLKGLKISDYLRSDIAVPRDLLFEVLRKRLNLSPIFEASEAAE